MHQSKTAGQIIDVNINRFSEGLKVVEDLVRLYLIDISTLNSIRKIKRQFWMVVDNLRKQVILSRKSEKDIGRQGKFDKNKRENLNDVLIINLKRCQESLRVLEETIKIYKPNQFGLFKQLRFRMYDLEKKIVEKINKKFDLSLYVIIDIKTTGRKHLKEITEACIKGGSTMIQLREPEDTSTKQWIKDAHIVKSAIKKPEKKFIINNRTDVALAVKANGVHVGENDISIIDARKILGDGKIIGVSANNPIKAKRAEKNSADYIGAGAIYSTPTKPDVVVIGIKQLKKIVNAVKIPVVAIGGINRYNAKQLKRLGVSGVAVISSIFKGYKTTEKNFTRKIINNLREFNRKKHNNKIARTTK